jgi:3-oxoacyl-[acyl-carrier protein] reductase
MPSEFDFTGKVVLVTGSSRGIGAGMLRAFAARGAKCVINYFADAAGQNLADAQKVAADAPGALLLPCDVGDAAQVADMFRAIESSFGRLDVLINNAGILRDRTIKKLTEEDWQAVLRTNLDGTFHCTQAAAARLLQSGGRIVNMSSVAAIGGFFGQANYAASKAAVIALTKVSARELARQQITVNAIAPGFIDTDMTKSMPQDVMQQFVQQIPLGRRGTIDDIIGPALFLCSPLAAYITGQVIHVNGGFWMP